MSTVPCNYNGECNLESRFLHYVPNQNELETQHFTMFGFL